MSRKTVGHWRVDEETGKLTQTWVVTVLPQGDTEEPEEEE